MKIKYSKYELLLIISVLSALIASVFTYEFIKMQINTFIYNNTITTIDKQTEILASTMDSKVEFKNNIALFKNINYIKSIKLNPIHKDNKTITKKFIYPDGYVKVGFVIDTDKIKQKAAHIASKLSIMELILLVIIMSVILASIKDLYLEPLRKIDADVKKISEGILENLNITKNDEFGRIRESINMMINSLRDKEARAGIISQFIYLLTIGKGFDGEFISLMRSTIEITGSDGVIMGVKDTDSDKVHIKLITKEKSEDMTKKINELEGIEPYILEFGKEIEVKETREKGLLSRREEEEGIEYFFGMPLKALSATKGFIVFFRKNNTPFLKREKNYLRNIARSISISVELKDLIKTLQKNVESEKQLFEASIKALVRGIEIRDSYTRGHSERVAYYSKRIAEEIGMGEKEANDIYLAALLHDIGKIGIPDSILMKPTKLTEEEYEIIKLHPILSYEMLKSIDALKGSFNAIKYHHERLDGSGYPEGLKGNEIPISARIIAVADTLDAMTSDRIYRKGLSKDRAIKEIIRLSGKLFDPDIVHTAVQTFRNEEPLIEKQDYLMLKEVESRRLDYFFRDQLTGTFNRNAFDYVYSKVVESRKKFTVVAIDIKQLRSINLEYGWNYGDEVLKKVAKAIGTILSPFATVRCSGDNFVVFLPNDTTDEKTIKSKINEIENLVGEKLSYYVIKETKDKNTLMKKLTEIERYELVNAT